MVLLPNQICDDQRQRCMYAQNPVYYLGASGIKLLYLGVYVRDQRYVVINKVGN